MNVTLYTTFAAIDNEVPLAVSQAINANVRNKAISSVVILTETDINIISQADPIFIDTKIRLIQKNKRPTFDDMFNEINHGFNEESCNLSILLNSDISVPDERVIYRLAKSINEITNSGEKVAFSLTRYEKKSTGEHLALQSSLGLPNVISSDAWVFSSTISCKKDLYYSMGQMYCDKFINHDLIASGYNLYNPCLDCLIVHNESDFKDAAYYRALSNEQNSKDVINRHWKNSVDKDGGYFGLSRLRSVSLVAGYRPKPIQLSSSRKRLFVYLSESTESIDGYLKSLIKNWSFATTPNFDMYLVVDSDKLHIYIDTFLAKLSINSNIYTYLVDEIDGVFNNLMNGVHDIYESVFYTQDWNCVTNDLIRLTSALFYDAREYKDLKAVLDDYLVRSFSERGVSEAEKKKIQLDEIKWISSEVVDQGKQSVSKESIIIVNFDSDVEDWLSQIMSSNLSAGIMFCTGNYAQFLNEKFKVL